MKIKPKQVVREVRRSVAKLIGGTAIAGQHLQLLRANLRDLRQVERECGDGLQARLATLEDRCRRYGESGVDRWLREWDAIEHGWASEANKRRAFRTLYSVAIERLAQAEASIRGQSSTLASSRRAEPIIRAGVSVAEAIDRLTWLELELASASDGETRTLREEYDELTLALAGAVAPSEALNGVRAELKALNAVRREIESRLREFERAANLGEAFVEMLRESRGTDERRAKLRRRIDELVRAVV